MTKETFEYEILTCDICKRRVKKDPKIKENSGFSFSLTNYSIASGTWIAHSGLEAEPVPEHIDMCDQCEESFKKWRAHREDRCGCADY